jgi:hypothetical protein
LIFFRQKLLHPCIYHTPYACDSVVGIDTRLRAGSFGVRIPACVGDFSSPERLDRLWGTPSLLFNGCRGRFPRVKRLWPHVDHSPSSAELKNEWSFNFTPLIRLHGVYRHNFTYVCVCYLFRPLYLPRYERPNNN